MSCFTADHILFPISPFTNRLLDELNAVGAKATFCLIGRQFPGFEDVVRRIAYEGHDLCIHTTSHPHLTELSSSAIIDEIMDTMLAFEQVLGVVPRYFRPPFGEVDLRVKAILDQLNLTMLRWNYDSYDYLRDTDQLMSRYKTYITRDGPSTSWMALQHDLHDTTVAMQQEIVRYARSQGFNVTTPSQCLNMTRWVTGELPLRSASWWTSATARSASQPTRTATLKGLGGGVASLYGDGELRTTRTTLVGSTSGPVTLTIVSDDSFTTSSLAESTNTMSNIGASPTATKKYSLESLIPAGADSSTKRALFVPLLLILFAVLL